MNQTRYKDKYRIKSIRLPDRDYAANGWYFVTICTHHRAHFFGNVSLSKVHLSPIGEIAQQFWLDIPKHFIHTQIDAYVIMPNHIHGIVVINRPPNGVETLQCNVSDSRPTNGDRAPNVINGTYPTNGDQPPNAIDGSYPTNGDRAPNVIDGAYPTNDDQSPNVTTLSNVVETLQCNVSTQSTPQRQFMSQISPKTGSLGTVMRSYKSAVTRWCHQNGYDHFKWQDRFYEHIIRADGSLNRIRQYIINNPAKWADYQKSPANLWM